MVLCNLFVQLSSMARSYSWGTGLRHLHGISSRRIGNSPVTTLLCLALSSCANLARCDSLLLVPSDTWTITGSQILPSSGNNSTNPIPVSLDDAGNAEKRGFIEFDLGAISTAGRILARAMLTINSPNSTSDSVLEYHGYAGDGFVFLQDAYRDDALVGRLEDYATNTPATVSLTPGLLSTLLGSVPYFDVVVRQETDLALGEFNDRFSANGPKLQLDFINISEPDSNSWVTTGNSSWNVTAHWTPLGIPIASDDLFIQPAVNDLISGPPTDKTYHSLTLGGGGGQATLQLATNRQFNVSYHTTLLQGGVLDLNNATFATNGLNMVGGGSIDWSSGGNLVVNDGYLSPGPGNFVVDGPNFPILAFFGAGQMLWKNEPSLSEHLVVGDSQTGYLTVGDGGTVRILGLRLGEDASSDGRLEVDGATAFLEAEFVCDVGAQGSATARVEHGGRLETRLLNVGGNSLAPANNSTFARFTATDAGTTVDVGSLFGYGWSETIITNGAKMNADFVGASSTAAVPPLIKVSGRDSVLDVTGEIRTGATVGGNGSSAFLVADGGRIEAEQLFLSIGVLSVGTAETTLTITDPDSEVVVNGLLALSALNDSVSTVEIQNGGLLRAESDALLSTSPDTVATVVVSGAGSRWEQLGELFIGGGRDINTQELLDGGEATVQLQSGGTIEVGNALHVMAMATLEISGGELNVPILRDDRGGTFSFTGGALSVEEFVGDLVNDGGTVAPGQSPGITSVSGLYDQNSGVLQIEILAGGENPQPGVSFDQLLAASAEIDGFLEVILDANYVPATGDVFPILETTGGVTGTFDTLASELPALGSDLQWEIKYLANSVQLSVTSSISLAGDFNADGVVDGDDFLVWQRGQSPDPLSSSDLLEWQNAYASSTGAQNAVAVPEPQTLLLFAILSVGIWGTSSHAIQLQQC